MEELLAKEKVKDSSWPEVHERAEALIRASALRLRQAGLSDEQIAELGQGGDTHANLLLPGAKKPIMFSNRIIWTTTLSLAHRRSPVTQADNSDLASLNTSGDYEIAKNLRLTLNGSMARLWHKYLKQEDYISYSMGTTLTFQF